MRLKHVPAARGVLWVREGFRCFFAQPLGYTAILALVLFAGVMLAQLPWIGPLASLALMPTATLAFLIAGREQRAGRPVHPGYLIAPWKDASLRAPLLRLGLAYGVAVMACLLVVEWFDGGNMQRLIESITHAAEAGTPPTLDDAVVSGAFASMMLASVLLGLVSLLFWHAPALVIWDRQPIAKALFASTMACWRGWRAYALMGLAWFSILLLFSLVAQTVLALLGLGGNALVIAMQPAALMFMTAFYASLYANYTDTFEQD
ncbi:BPSS1780 family membrane protein [Caldimonas sp. KR1-144]|uniref:BPSS1780 family membrane protein n=1 Tax=Caldimonas sp. KR1-144 TaxID=3400911 RepID=UPI003BFED2FC